LGQAQGKIPQLTTPDPAPNTQEKKKKKHGLLPVFFLFDAPPHPLPVLFHPPADLPAEVVKVAQIVPQVFKEKSVADPPILMNEHISETDEGFESPSQIPADDPARMGLLDGLLVPFHHVSEGFGQKVLKDASHRLIDEDHR
jgi:hypothetical protein